MKIYAAVLAVLLGPAVGCQTQSQPARTEVAPPQQAAAVQAAVVQDPIAQPEAASSTRAASFDFYLLNLSWSPEFCVTHPGGLECTQHRGFTVHGLWPQNNDGTYPKNCGSRPGPTNPAEWADFMPDTGLVRHEWQTHGVCTPFDANTYFGMIRKAFQEVKVPPAVGSAGPNAMLTPAVIIDDFAKANPSFPAGSLAMSCGNNHLTAIEVCMNKSLQPIACKAVPSCKAKVVKITPN